MERAMTERPFAEVLKETTEKCRALDAPLGERLKVVADEVRRRAPRFADAVDRLVAHLEKNGIGLSAPKPGEPMPDFVLPDEGGHLVRLADLLEGGPVVLSFNRGHWCPYCQLNVDALAKIAPEIERMGAHIVAIAPETRRYTAELKSYAKAPFPVLSDIDGAYALELNLLFWVGEEKREAMQAIDVDISPYQGNESWMLPIPATFVIGQNGIVKARHVDPDYRRRMEIDDLLAALKS
jgi:peroxiredoxin